MAISRRHLFQHLAGAAAAAMTPRHASAGELDVLPPGGESTPGAIRLNRNESPYGPSPKALDAMRRAAAAAVRYPDSAADDLRAALAAFHGVTPDEIVLGCGSSEVVRMAVDAYVGPQKRLVTAVPTHTWPAETAQRLGADVALVPLTREYAHDLVAMRAAAGDTPGLVYICNPNNPTGTLTRRADLEAFIRSLPSTTCVLVDEAYHHYVRESAGYRSFIDDRLDDPRIIVLRTFSKIFGLAGLRVGYAVASPTTARTLAAHRLADGVNAVAARAAIAALDDRDYLRSCTRRNVDDRQEFYNQANARMVKGIDSHGNFAFMNAGESAVDVVDRLRTLGVILPPPFARFDTYIRVSFGTPSEMRAFWRAWDRASGKMTM